MKKELADLLTASDRLFGCIYIRSNVAELTGEYATLNQFKGVAFKYNNNLFLMASIEFIGSLKKWALYDYFGSWSGYVGREAMVWLKICRENNKHHTKH